jgi:hypothetical protein
MSVQIKRQLPWHRGCGELESQVADPALGKKCRRSKIASQLHVAMALV